MRSSSVKLLMWLSNALQVKISLMASSFIVQRNFIWVESLARFPSWLSIACTILILKRCPSSLLIRKILPIRLLESIIGMARLGAEAELDSSVLEVFSEGIGCAWRDFTISGEVKGSARKLMLLSLAGLTLDLDITLLASVLRTLKVISCSMFSLMPANLPFISEALLRKALSSALK